MLNARIKRLRPDVSLPVYHTSEAAGFDLAASEDVTVQPGEVKQVEWSEVEEIKANSRGGFGATG